MNKQQIQSRVEELRPWYQSVELPHGVVTPGHESVGGRTLETMRYRWEMVTDNVKIKGATVMDMGAAEGANCLYAARAGAKTVYPVEISRARYDRLAWCVQCWEPFSRKVRSIQSGRACISPIFDDGRVDVAFVFSVAHYFEHPFYTLERIRQTLRAGGTAFFELAVMPQGSSEVMFRGPERVGIIFPYEGFLSEYFSRTYSCVMMLDDPTPHAGGGSRRIFFRCTV